MKCEAKRLRKQSRGNFSEYENGKPVYYQIKKKWLRKTAYKKKMSEKDLQKYQAKQEAGSDDDSDRRRRRRLMMRLVNAEAAMSA